MRLIPMSISETMLDIFYTPAPSALRHYTTWHAPDIEASIRQTWCRVWVTWERGQAGACAVRFERNLPPEGIDAMGHDQLRFFGAIAPDVMLKLTVNGRAHEFRGDDEPAYHAVPIGADRVNSLRFEYIPQTSGVGGATLIWLALVQSVRDAERLTQRGHYDPDWDGFLLPEGTEPEPRVELGLLFDQDELEALRAKAFSPLYRPWMDRLRQQAREKLEVQPESLIGRFAFEPLLYTRPKERKALNAFGHTHVHTTLAFAGLLDEDLNMLRHAARWMLSVAHCEYWYNDAAGELPGTPWHHRSFTESQLTYQVSLCLDWAGSMLTPEGRDLIRDAIARRGLPRMQQDFMDSQMEYIYSMNQGIVFNSGRLMGLLALLKAWPRAEAHLTSAQADTMEMFSRTFTEDGGSVEGPGYWQYTLSEGLPGVIALAKYRNCSAADLLPGRMRRAPGYPPVMASTAQTGHALSISDSHSPPLCRVDLAAMMAHIFPDSESERLASYVLGNSYVDGPEDIPLLILFGPRAVSKIQEIVPEFAVLEKTGQAVVCRPMPDVGLVRLQIIGAASGVSGSHSHDDRGNILLEAGGEEILIDRGIGSYSSVLGELNKRPGAHNLLVPDTPDGSVPKQDIEHPNDICPEARYQDGRFRATIEPTETWPDHVISCTRSIDSETPDVFEITDELELTQPLGATLHFHTPCDARQEAKAWVLIGKGIQALIEPLWPVAEATFALDDLGISEQSGGSAYGHLQIRSAPARIHRLVTRITVQKKEVI